MKSIYDKLKIAGMDEIILSDEEHPYIGTWGLATCYGILIYDVKNRAAILAHASDKYEEVLNDLLAIMFDKESGETTFKYMIVPGNEVNTNDVINSLSAKLNKLYNKDFHFIPFNENYKDIISINPGTKSYQFAFNSQTGKFITNKIKFTKENIVEGTKYGRNHL
jgi:hypothetical protein